MDVTKIKFLLKNTIEYFDIAVSLLVLIIFTYNIIMTSYMFYINESPLKKKIEQKIKFIESISLSLSFILCIEILKLFYIKRYRQLVIVCALVIIKLLISFFVNREMNQEIIRSHNLT